MSKAGKIASLFGAGSTTINPALVVVPAAVPPGTMVPFSGATAPTDWLFCYGQAVSRTTYAALFTAIGTTYGVGDGSTTFNLPDMRGRVPGGKDDMGGSAAGVLNVTLTGTKASTSSGVITGLSSTAALSVGMKAFGTGIGTNAVINSIGSSTQVTLSVNSTSTGSTSIRFGVVDGATLGATGGSQTHALTAQQLAAHSHPVTDPGHNHGSAVTGGGAGGGSFGVGDNGVSASNSATTGITVGNNTNAGGSHPNIQPTLVLNYVIKT